MPDPQQGRTPPNLRAVERYLAVLARAEHPGTPAIEAQRCREQLRAWEGEHDRLRETALRVAAALEGAGPRPGATAPEMDEFERELARVLDPSVPWWARAYRAVTGLAPHAGGIVQNYRDALDRLESAPPLAAGRYEVRLSTNAHGELVITMRMAEADAAVPARREHVLDIVRKRLARRAA